MERRSPQKRSQASVLYFFYNKDFFKNFITYSVKNFGKLYFLNSTVHLQSHKARGFNHSERALSCGETDAAFHPTSCNIVGRNMRLLDHPVAAYCEVLRGYCVNFELGQTFRATCSNISIVLLNVESCFVCLTTIRNIVGLAPVQNT